MTATVRRILAAVVAVLILCQIAFILSNSAKNAVSSDAQSGRVVRFVFEQVLGKDYETLPQAEIDSVTHVIRKGAHFTEFAMLGALVFLLLALLQRRLGICFSLSVSAVFLVGCIDELVQLTSPGRACRFSDVLIDTSGGATAAAVLFLGMALFSAHAARRREKSGENAKAAPDTTK